MEPRSRIALSRSSRTEPEAEAKAGISIVASPSEIAASFLLMMSSKSQSVYFMLHRVAK